MVSGWVGSGGVGGGDDCVVLLLVLFAREILNNRSHKPI